MAIINWRSIFELVVGANPDAKRLYDDLLSNYNKLVRPVANVSDALTVKIKLKLSQLIDVVTIHNTLHHKLFWTLKKRMGFLITAAVAHSLYIDRNCRRIDERVA